MPPLARTNSSVDLSVENMSLVRPALLSIQHRVSQHSFVQRLERISEKLKKAITLTQTNAGHLFLAMLFSNLASLDKNHAETLKQLENHKSEDDKQILASQLIQISHIRKSLELVADLVVENGADNVDEKIKTNLEILNKLIALYNKSNHYKSARLDTIFSLNRFSNYFYSGTLISTVFVSIADALALSLPPALTAAGKLFPPILYAADTVIILLTLIYTLATSFYLSLVEKQAKVVLRSPLYKKDFSLRSLSNFVAFSLQFVAVLVFSSVLASSPVGWALIAGASIARWISELYIGARRAKLNYLEEEKKWSELKKNIDTIENLKEPAAILAAEQSLNRLKEKEEVLAENVKILKKQDYEKDIEAIWGFVGALGSVVFACGFFLPPLAVLGFAMICFPAMRNAAKATYEFLAPYFEKRRKAPEAEEATSYNTQGIGQGLQQAALLSPTHEREVSSDPELSEKRRSKSENETPDLALVSSSILESAALLNSQKKLNEPPPSPEEPELATEARTRSGPS